MTDLPLDGVRVLEISPGYAAGFAGRLLAGFGADVVIAGDPGSELTPDELIFLTAGKRRVTADSDSLRTLALAADILLDDCKPGTLASEGLDPGSLRAENPALTVVSITPFGQTGPASEWEATNLTAFAMGGIVSLTGHASREPLVTGGSQAYALGGLNGFSAAVTAYYGRLVHGEGDWIDISMQECSAAMLELYGPGSAATGMGPSPRRGNHVRAVWGIYPCADGWAGVCCLERQVHAFLDLLDNPVLSEERFRDPMQRAEHDDELNAIVYSWFLERTKAEIIALGPKTRVPFGAVMTPGDLLANESIAERGFFDCVSTPDGEARFPGRPFLGIDWRPPHVAGGSVDAATIAREWQSEPGALATGRGGADGPGVRA